MTTPTSSSRRRLPSGARQATRLLAPEQAGPLRRTWRTYPRLSVALKAATAAAIAWLLVKPFGGFADSYPYYAPLGAVVAVSTTVASSLRASRQAALAIAIGAGTAVAARALPLPEVAALALAVGVGTVAAGWPMLGGLGSWVPISALFVLIVGQRDPARYVLAYLGLTTLGAVVGVVVNAVFPSLPLTPTGLALRRLRVAVAEQLDEIASGLREPDPPTPEEWATHCRALTPYIDRVRTLVAETAEARRANWRARRWRQSADRQYAVATVLEDLTAVTNQIVALVTERERADTEEPALGTSLRPLAADAFSGTARMLEVFDDDEAFDVASRHTSESLDALRAATSSAWHEAGEDRYTAAAIVTGLERVTSGLEAGRPRAADA